MKANQFSKKEEAQVGIGTMIVFIATILVAAVAAGVLIDTSQKLQSKSTQTGDAATQQVGSTLVFQTVYGQDFPTFVDETESPNATAADAGDIDYLDIWLKPAAGADPINLEQLVIQLKAGDGTTTFQYDDNTIAYRQFDCAGEPVTEFFVYDDDGTNLASDHVLAAGEKAMIRIGYFSQDDWDDDGDGLSPDVPSDMCTDPLDLGTSASLELSLIPEVGSPITKAFTTPNTFNGQTVFEF